MKPVIRWLLGWMALSSVASGAEFEEQRTTLTIKPDGSSQLMHETLKPRALAERQVRAWQDSEKVRQRNDREEAASRPPPIAAEPKPFTDEELAETIRARTGAENLLVGPDWKIESLDVKTNTVRKVASRSYATLPEMVGHAWGIWADAGLAFSNIRFEKDPEGHLRITHLPGPGMPGYTSSLRSQWKRVGFKSEFKLVLPGKVLVSGLGASKDSATWIAVDAQNSDSLEAALKLFDAPMVITAELGGLKLDRILESKILSEQARHGGSASAELPIADAGPGFWAEPIRLTTSSLYVFPEGTKDVGQRNPSGSGGPGVVIRARLFAPKDRTFQSVSGVRVLQATDDKGRMIAAGSTPTTGEPIDYGSLNSRQSNSIEIQLRLQLPQSDARAIEDVAAEVVAVTTGTWKELTLTNLQESATNLIDLASVLQGAAITITKLSPQTRPVIVEARIKGPPAIRQIELQMQVKGHDRFFNSRTSDRNYSAKGEDSTRSVTVTGYGLDDRDRLDTEAISLVVRSPQDQRREQVRFNLRGLELH